MRDGSKLTTVSASTTSYTDTTASPSTTYRYTVSAFDTAQQSSGPSTTASVTTPAATPADAPPTVPGNVAATARSATVVDLSLERLDRHRRHGRAGYTIMRDGSKLTTVSASTTSYTDTTASPSTTYRYTVSAFDTAQQSSGPSNPASVTTPAVSPTDGPPTVPGKAAFDREVGHRGRGLLIRVDRQRTGPASRATRSRATAPRSPR